MKRYFSFLLFCLLVSRELLAQGSFKTRLEEINTRITALAVKPTKQIVMPSSSKGVTLLPTGVLQLMRIKENTAGKIGALMAPDSINLGDTLIIGAFPGDSIVITGSYFHSGPVVILNDGYLGFKNANATILGDVFIAGPAARLAIDSSVMFFPQEYFYQRTLLLALKARLDIRNSIMDYSSLSHNLVATDSAIVNMEDVTYSGFTTNGFYRQSQITMNGCNQAGEYVITDSCRLSFTDVSTLLLWHQVPAQASLHIDFPDGTYVSQYQFHPGQVGASGLEYSIEVTSSSEVWWALMPSGGSDVVVQHSAIRAIGLWFEGNDTVNVSGLVNNSTYSQFTAGLNDRNLQLTNSSVMTWSLYPMDDSYVKVQSCILGEIGTMNRSRCENTGVFADGSGGYVWAVDTTFMVMAFSSLSSSIRSDRNGILLIAYDAVTNGQVQAQGNSIMMVLQSTLSEPPVLLDKACLWTAYINLLQDAYAGLQIPLTGTASIEKTPASNLMDFYAYRLLYQRAGETGWTNIGSLYHTEKEMDTLGIWNTTGLQPGAYTLKMILYDDTPDTNAVEIVRSVNLLPLFMGEMEFNLAESFFVYPSPASQTINISYNKPNAVAEFGISDIGGRKVMTGMLQGGKSNILDVSGLENGVYIVSVYDQRVLVQKKFLVLK
jgi:hypothetical protein